MAYFEKINKKLTEVQYGYNFQSLFIMLPGLSLLAQKCQVQWSISLLKSEYEVPKNYNVFSHPQYKKIDRIYKWHTIGNAIQTIAYATLARLRSRLFAIPLAITAYQLYYAFTGYRQKNAVVFLSPKGGLTIQR